MERSAEHSALNARIAALEVELRQLRAERRQASPTPVVEDWEYRDQRHPFVIDAETELTLEDMPELARQILAG